MNNFKDYITLKELAKELREKHNIRLSKSTLHYYSYIGLIKRECEFNEIHLYNREKIILRLIEIDKLKNKGFTLEEMKKQIK